MRKGTHDYNPISTIQELVNFGRAELSNPNGKVQRRHFFVIDDNEIKQPPAAKIVTGSRSLYAYRVRGSMGSMQVEARPFACYCDGCVRFAHCHRPGGPWQGTSAGDLTPTQVSTEASDSDSVSSQ